MQRVLPLSPHIGKGAEEKGMKRVICIFLIIFSTIGIISAIQEYCGGYEEIPATVTKTFVSRKRYTLDNQKYNLEWIDKDGEIVQHGSIRNKFGYSEGDVIMIKVDAKKHHTLYSDYIPMICMFSVMLVVSGTVMAVSFKKKQTTRLKSK